MVTRTVISVEAVFRDGVLRPTEELPLRANDRVLLRIELQPESRTWPDDTAEIYAETDAEDRAIAAGMASDIVTTWPNASGAE